MMEKYRECFVLIIESYQFEKSESFGKNENAGGVFHQRYFFVKRTTIYMYFHSILQNFTNCSYKAWFGTCFAYSFNQAFAFGLGEKAAQNLKM